MFLSLANVADAAVALGLLAHVVGHVELALVRVVRLARLQLSAGAGGVGGGLVLGQCCIYVCMTKVCMLMLYLHLSVCVSVYQSIFQSIWLLVCIYSYLYFCISGLYISKCIIYVYIMHLSIFTFPLSIVFLIDFFCQNRISISDLYTILISNSTISSF